MVIGRQGEVFACYGFLRGWLGGVKNFYKVTDFMDFKRGKIFQRLLGKFIIWTIFKQL